jgi:DNA-binding response OmpR family regulator
VLDRGGRCLAKERELRVNLKQNLAPGQRQTGKDGSVVNGQRVLVVDGMHEIQEVLHAVLAPRGLRVDWVRSHVQHHSSGTADCPDILVIDAEALPIQKSGGTRNWNNVPQVILGADQDSSTTDVDTQHTYLPKPFHYPDLIRAIEKLLPKRVA